MMKTFAVAALTGLAAINPACAEKLKVVASFSIIGDFAREVGKDHIDLKTLVGPGGDTHAYEPRPSDAAALKDAKVILVNGQHFEGFIDRLVQASGTSGSIAELIKGVELLKTEEEGHAHSETAHDEHDHGAFDPHAFQSAANAVIYVRNIADAFCAADAANCADYKANAGAYAAELTKLDAEIKATLATIPAERRNIITAHDAFGYFGHAYGLQFLAPEGVSTDAEASAADVAALIRQTREDKVGAIFLENVTNPKLIAQISAETGVKVGGTLYSDALSDGPPAATYIEMMRTNANTIKAAAGS